MQAIVIKNINHKPYAFKTMINNTSSDFSKTDIEMVLMFNNSNKIDVWDREKGKKIIQGRKAKLVLDKLSGVFKELKQWKLN